jgi:hypothetical protein
MWLFGLVASVVGSPTRVQMFHGPTKVPILVPYCERLLTAASGGVFLSIQSQFRGPQDLETF